MSQKIVVWGGVVLVVLGGAVAAYCYAGAYNVAADDPHWEVTARIIAAARDRSIAVRAQGLVPPDLADPDLIASGAKHYEAMCAGCHLKPNQRDNELRAGLYPSPPNLTSEARETDGPRATAREPGEQFWIIKHGIKMSGMPAWGASHDDRSIWALVAFLRKLPALDAAAYGAMTGHQDAPYDHGDHQHEANESGPASQRLLNGISHDDDQAHAHVSAIAQQPSATAGGTP